MPPPIKPQAGPPPEDPYAEDGWVSKDFVDAVNGDRESALEMWASVASASVATGKLYREDLEWVVIVAQRILEADKDKSNTRAESLMKAIGLANKADQWRGLREVASALRDFGATREEIIRELDRQKLYDPDEVDTRSLLDRQLRK